MLVAAMLSQCFAVEEFGVGTGSITVHNDNDKPIEVMVSDTNTCFAGLRASLGANTTRQFDVAEQAFLCVGPNASAGTAVTDGNSYEIRGMAVSVRSE